MADLALPLIVGASIGIALVAVVLGVLALRRRDRHRAAAAAASDELDRRSQLQDIADSDPMPWGPLADRSDFTTPQHRAPRPVHRHRPVGYTPSDGSIPAVDE